MGAAAKMETYLLITRPGRLSEIARERWRSAVGILAASSIFIIINTILQFRLVEVDLIEKPS